MIAWQIKSTDSILQEKAPFVEDENLPPPPPLPEDSTILPLKVAPAKKNSNKGIGSMEAYILMKEQRRHAIDKGKNPVEDVSHSASNLQNNDGTSQPTGNFTISCFGLDINENSVILIFCTNFRGKEDQKR